MRRELVVLAPGPYRATEVLERDRCFVRGVYRGRRRVSGVSGGEISFAVVIPALNEEIHIGSLLSDVAHQTRSPTRSWTRAPRTAP